MSPCCQLVVVELRAAKGLVVAAWCCDRRHRSANIDLITWYPHLDNSHPPGYPHLVSPVQGSGVGPLELEAELAVTRDHTELVAVARCGNLAKLRLPV